MRNVFKSGLLDASDGVNPLVMEAVSPEVEARDPIEKAAAGPGKVGELGGGRRGVVIFAVGLGQKKDPSVA